MSRVRKAIAYAYPTSVRAGELGSAGWYVEQYHIREDGSWSAPYIAQGCHDVFPSEAHPNLLALFAEVDGEPCPHWQAAQARGPLARLRHHVTGAISRGEAVAIVEVTP